MNPCNFYKCLADDTRLKSLLLICVMKEACVCELMSALELDQPKISRHLSALRKCGILHDERRGKWVFYQLHPELPEWSRAVIQQTAQSNPTYFQEALVKLKSAQIVTNNCC
jgi:ArsR family transcriptional regulator